MIDRTIYWALSPGPTGHLRVLRFGNLAAVIGLTLTALSLAGSTGKPATSSIANSPLAEEIRRGNAEGKKRYSAGRYLEARTLFLAAASRAHQAGDMRSAAMYWNNAGASAVARMDYRDAQLDFLKARNAARTSREFVPLAVTMNNLASLYLQMGNAEAAIRIADEALAGPVGSSDRMIHPKLQFQLASALARVHRFAEADGIYKEAVGELEEQGDFDTTARVLASLGSAALEANRPDEAETALSKALLLVRLHHLTASANVLRGLAQVESRRGDLRSAAALFDAAIAEPQSLTPLWVIFADRGQFRLDHDELRGALADFREAHRLARLMRADIVPADQDRIAFESGLNRVGAGLVDAGNRLAQKTSDRMLLKETFDIAEEDRLWSLRALVPAANDWRTRLPAGYWDLLAGYQSIRRGLMMQPSAEMQKRASELQRELQDIEAGASPGSKPENTRSALTHVRSVLDADSVLFSFYVTKSGGWLWAVDRSGVDVYPIPSLENLQSRVADFTKATREGDPRAITSGSQLYKDLFGEVPAVYLAHKRWLLELDGPLFDLPFASLIVGTNKGIRKNGEKLLDSSSMVWNDSPCRVWSLWELIEPYASDAAELMLTIANIHTIVLRMTVGGVPVNTKIVQPSVPIPYFDKVEQFCRSLSLDHGLNRTKRIRQRLTDGISFTDLSQEVNVLKESVMDQLKSRKFLYIPPERIAMHDAVDLFGAEVRASFPRSDFHVRESGTCMSLQRPTASVYHLMCVLEGGLDSLSHAVGLPESQKNWSVILKQIEDQITGMGQATPKADKEFYSRAAIEFNYFREAWRNHVAHGRAKFTETEASKVFEHVKDFMVHLSTRLVERP